MGGGRAERQKAGDDGLIVKSLDADSVRERDKAIEKVERELAGLMPENPFDTILAEVVRRTARTLSGKLAGASFGGILATRIGTRIIGW